MTKREIRSILAVALPWVIISMMTAGLWINHNTNRALSVSALDSETRLDERRKILIEIADALLYMGSDRLTRTSYIEFATEFAKVNNLKLPTNESGEVAWPPIFEPVEIEVPTR